jgi:hypothetical protein
MAQPAPPAPEGQGEAPPSRLRQLIHHTACVGLGLGILGLGWFILQAYLDLNAARPATPAPKKYKLRLKDLLPGAWAFGDNSWAFGLHRLSTAEVKSRMRSLDVPAASAGPPSQLEKMALQWLRRAGKARRKGELADYRLALNGTSVRAVTRGKGSSERICLVQMIQPGPAGGLFEARPLPEKKTGGDGANLLPLPKGVAALAHRHDPNGDLSAQLVGPAPFAKCKAHWQEAGWDVSPAPLEAGLGSICRKDDQAVFVLRWAGPKRSEYLLLVPASLIEQQSGE